MASRSQLEEAARLLAPLPQGGLDGLCSLYAVINGLRLVLHPFRHLRRPELKRLFDCGIGSLGRNRQLRASITYGVTDRMWLRLCDDVVAEAAVMTGLELFSLPLFEPHAAPHSREAIGLIKHSLRDGWPVLIALMDSYDHSSVISGFSRTRFRLFDSSSHRWVWIRSLSFDPDARGATHFVPLTSMIALMAF